MREVTNGGSRVHPPEVHLILWLRSTLNRANTAPHRCYNASAVAGNKKKDHISDENFVFFF